MLLWRLVVKGFLLLCGRLLFHCFPASLRKNKKLPHLVKSSSVVAVKEGDRMCSLAPSLLLPVPLPHPSDSPAAYLKPMKGALLRGFSLSSPSPPRPQPKISEAHRREISPLANSSSPVHFGLELHSPEGEQADGRWKARLGAATKGGVKRQRQGPGATDHGAGASPNSAQR